MLHLSHQLHIWKLIKTKGFVFVCVCVMLEKKAKHILIIHKGIAFRKVFQFCKLLFYQMKISFV